MAKGDMRNVSMYDRIERLEKKIIPSFWDWFGMLAPFVLLGGLFWMILDHNAKLDARLSAFIAERIEHDQKVEETVNKLWDIWGK